MRRAKRKTKIEAVAAVLHEHVRYRVQTEIASLFGTIDYDRKYHSKAECRRRRR